MNKETIMDGEGNGVQYSKEDLYQKSKLKQGIARSNSVLILMKWKKVSGSLEKV